jgi:hypothetical protein
LQIEPFPPAFLISQKSKIFDSFPPGEAFWALPRQYDKLQFTPPRRKEKFDEKLPEGGTDWENRPAF